MLNTVVVSISVQVQKNYKLHINSLWKSIDFFQLVLEFTNDIFSYKMFKIILVTK